MPLGSARPAAIFPKLRSSGALRCLSPRSVQEQALAAGEEDENESFGTRSFGTDTTHTIQSDLSRADFRVPVYFIENGARQGGASRSDGPPWLVTLERKRARQSESLCGTETREMDSEPRREKERSVTQRDADGSCDDC